MKRKSSSDSGHAEKKRRRFDKLDDDTIAAVITKHFSSNCDLCPAQLHSLDQAIRHYRDDHQMLDGYLVCCDKKWKRQLPLVDHVRWHLNPNVFR